MHRAIRILFVVLVVFAFVMAVLPKPPVIPGQPSDKFLHVTAFGTLGMLAAVGFHRQSAVALLAWLAGFGALIEIAQAIPSLHRDSSLLDLVADVCAAVLAIGVTRWLMKRRARSGP